MIELLKFLDATEYLDAVVKSKEEELTRWRRRRADAYAKLRKVCPHEQVETYSLDGHTEKMCLVCKADLTNRR